MNPLTDQQKNLAEVLSAIANTDFPPLTNESRFATCLIHAVLLQQREIDQLQRIIDAIEGAKG